MGQWRGTRSSEGRSPGPTRVSTLELFFDLVFVFTITQLTSVLASHPSLRGVAQVALMLGVIWWMYGGYAWLTNAVPADRPSRRFLLLGGMASYLVLALAITHAFSGAGTAFGLAYAAIVIVHAWLFTRSTSQSVVRNILRIAPVNLVGATLVLAGGIAGGTAQYVLWAIAVPLLWLSPKVVSNSGFEVGAEHFVERHGLVVLIAIGESVVAVGRGRARAPGRSRARGRRRARPRALRLSLVDLLRRRRRARRARPARRGRRATGRRSRSTPSATATSRSCSGSWPSRRRCTRPPRIRSTSWRRHVRSRSQAAWPCI